MIYNILPTQLKNMSPWWKFMCGCEFCISGKSIHSYLFLWLYCYLKILNTKSTIFITEGLVKWSVMFLKYVRMMWYRMFIIYTKHPMTWLWLKISLNHSPKMHYLTGNVRCFTVKFFHVLLSKFMNKIIIPKNVSYNKFSYLQNGILLYSSWPASTIWGDICFVFCHAKNCTKCNNIYK